jgi:N-acetylglutamate synthase-like GNAT family acetyltransferase
MSSDPAARPTPSTVYLRAAVAADAPVIRRMVYAAGINPLSLHWQNFVVAEDALRMGEAVVGIGQVKQHGDGSRELASIAVRPEWQGIGSAIVRTLLAREHGPLYLLCREQLTGYYARFGFCTVTAELPPSMRRIQHIGRAVLHVARVFRRDVPEPVVMMWPESDEADFRRSVGQQGPQEQEWPGMGPPLWLPRAP